MLMSLADDRMNHYFRALSEFRNTVKALAFLYIFRVSLYRASPSYYNISMVFFTTASSHPSLLLDDSL